MNIPASARAAAADYGAPAVLALILVAESLAFGSRPAAAFVVAWFLFWPGLLTNPRSALDSVATISIGAVASALFGPHVDIPHVLVDPTMLAQVSVSFAIAFACLRANADRGDKAPPIEKRGPAS